MGSSPTAATFIRISGMDTFRSIGIIAGNGVYPETFVRATRLKCPDMRIVGVGFENETDDSLEKQLDAYKLVRVGQLSKLISFFKDQEVSEVVMMGQISPKNLFDLRPDLRILLMLARVKKRNAETLFGAIAEELERDAIKLLPATTHLEDHLPAKGHVFGPKLKPRSLADMEYGFEIAKQSSALDIGQSVVVRHGTVLAVEAFEGTNACIRRGGELGRKKDTVLVKVSKPNQDFRFDVPVIGPQTIITCAEAGVHAIAIEALSTILLEKETVQRLCEDHKVTVYAL